MSKHWRANLFWAKWEDSSFGENINAHDEKFSPSSMCLFSRGSILHISVLDYLGIIKLYRHVNSEKAEKGKRVQDISTVIILLISWILTQEGLTLSQNNGFLFNLDLFHLENRLLPGMFPHIKDLCSECKNWNTETFWRFDIRINWMFSSSSSSTAQNPNWSGKYTLRGTPGTRSRD